MERHRKSPRSNLDPSTPKSHSCFFCLLDLILYVPSTIFQLNRDGSSWVEPVLRYDKCVSFKDHNAVTPVRLESAAPRSRLKHSSTEPLRSHPLLGHDPCHRINNSDQYVLCLLFVRTQTKFGIDFINKFL